MTNNKHNKYSQPALETSASVMEIKKKIKELKLVDVQELPSIEGLPIFLLTIGGENVRLYLDRHEANKIADYMTKVILVTIIKFLRGTTEEK